MKKLFLVLFCLSFMVVYGSNNPESVAKNYVEYLYKGNIEKALQCVGVFEPENDEYKTRAKNALYKESIDFLKHTNKQGGFKNVEALSSEVNKDTARVRLQVNYKNNTSQSNDFTLHKKDGKWYLQLGYDVASYEDSDIAKGATNFSALIADLTAYHTAKGITSNDFKEMTNVNIGENGEFYVGEYPCLKVTIKDNVLVVINNNKDNNKLCTNFMQKDFMKQILGVDLSKNDFAIINFANTYTW